MNKERLLNVAKALREALHPEQFDMKRYVHPCGTPSCAFGHYAARGDLQTVFAINTTADPNRFCHQGVHLVGDSPDEAEVTYAELLVLEHFDITEEQADELFGDPSELQDGFMDPDEFPEGYARLGRSCKTPIEAAEYIERFVANTP